MDQEQIEAASDAEFNAAFNGVIAPDSTPAAAAEPAAPAEVAEGDEQEPAEQQAPEQPEEKAVLAGLTEAQIERLLARAARVDDLEQLVSKAHGKIGELNRSVQELRKPPTNAAKPAATQAADAELSAFERDYPDVAAFVNAKVSGVSRQPEPAAEQPEPAHEAQPDQVVQVPDDRQTQLGLMDYFHEGWRDKVQSDEFKLWLQAQPPELNQTYMQTESAKVLGSIVGKFDSWQEARRTRQDAGRKRLEQAMTPTANPSRTKTAPTADDEFAEGFNSVIRNRS